MIDAFVFTKDRACQLHLLLSSCAKNAPGMFRFEVLWKASHPVYEKGYALAQNLWPGVSFLPEEIPLKHHFLDVIRRAGERSGSLCLFTDDCVFYRRAEFGPASVLSLLEDPEVLTFAFRLGHNTVVQNYQTGQLQPPLVPDLLWDNRFPVWQYARYHFSDNYGYPFGMDGHVFRCRDLERLTEPMEMPTFRAWEGALHLPEHRDRESARLMACPELSYVLNIPRNSVQSDPCPAGVHHPSDLLDLNDCFLRGMEIDLDSMDFSGVRSSHLELPWRLRARENQE